MQELLDAVSQIQNNPELAEKLNLSVTDILKQEKEKIGKGWIRKLLDIKTRLTEKEKQNLETRLYGENSSYKIDATKTLELKDKSEEGIEEAYTLLKEMQLPGVFTFEKGEIMFAGLTPPYSENFKKFFLANMTEILSKPEYYTEFQKMHNKMEAVIKDPNIFSRFHAGRYTINVGDVPKQLHPGVSAVINMQGKNIGIIGRVHPSVCKDEVYLFEINLDKLLQNRTSKLKAKEISKYLGMQKDVAFVVKKEVTNSSLTF